MKKGTMIDLTKYSHNRDADFKKSSDDLRDVIDNFTDQDQMSRFFGYFKDKYSLPESVIKQKFKKHMASLYVYKKALFNEKLKLSGAGGAFVKYLGFLFYVLIYSRKHKDVRKYKLIIDSIATKIELLRFKKLIDLFSKENVLIITTNKAVKTEFSDYKIKLEHRFKGYDRNKVLKVVWTELIWGICRYVFLSLKLKVNLFPIVTSIVNDYLFYSTLFNTNRADYIIQERHYITNSLKNYLFKKYGGCAATSIQKNILQLDTLFYYCDIDLLFSLGKQTTKRFYEYGGRIGQVVPVGSMFMEYYWFGEPREVNKEFDVVMMGMNIMNAYERMDSYSNFMNDYYDCFRWLVRFKKDHPNYRIGIKHHLSAGEDKIENAIITDSGIEILLKTANSYEVAFSSGCCVSYGSTMGYELNAHGVPALFLDPNYRCTFIPDRDDTLLEGLRVASYEDFRKTLIAVLNGGKGYLKDPDDLCLSSMDVSKKIYEILTENFENKLN